MVDAKHKAFAVGAAFLLVFAGIGVALSYKQVPEGHEGVTKEWGAVTGETLNPGAHWKIPIAQSVQDVEVRPRTYTMSQKAGEGDKSRADAITVKTVNGTSVDVDVTIRYRIDANRSDQFVEDWNDERQMERRLIRPSVRSDLRDEASSIQTSEIYTQEGREALTDTARESLREEFADEPIVLEEVQIRNIDLPKSIDTALDRKEEAKQQVQVEQEKVKQERARAEQERVKARADADVIRIKGEALADNEVVLRDRYIDALREGGAIYVVPDDGGNPVLLEADAQGNTTVTPGGGK